MIRMSFVRDRKTHFIKRQVCDVFLNDDNRLWISRSRGYGQITPGVYWASFPPDVKPSFTLKVTGRVAVTEDYEVVSISKEEADLFEGMYE